MKEIDCYLPIYYCATYCATNKGRWGKGTTIPEAMKNAGVKSFTQKDVKFIITAAILKNPTETEVTDILACLTANPTWGNAEYYTENRTETDNNLIGKIHFAWMEIHKNY